MDSEVENSITQFDNWDFIDDGLNLMVGSPSIPLLKMAANMLKTASVDRLAKSDSQWLLQYGPEFGDRNFREALAKFLNEEYSSSVAVEDLVVTAGATQGFSMLCNLLFSSSDPVFVENPTYFIATKVIEDDAKMSAIAVPTDENGIMPNELERILELNKHRKPRPLTERQPFWGLLYLISTFHNPTGICLPADRCRRVVELARKYDLLVVSDDVYNLLYFGENPPHRLFEFDKKTDPDYKGNVVSNASFSKIFGPGCRLGWMEAPGRVKNVILSSGLSSSGGGFNHYMSGIMNSVISLGLLKEMLLKARPLYQEQCKAACDVMRTQLPSLSFVEPKGGYFLWIKLPDGIIAQDLIELCKREYRTIFFPGNSSSPLGGFKNYIRISFSYYDKTVLAQGVSNIVKAVKTLQSKLPAAGVESK